MKLISFFAILFSLEATSQNYIQTFDEIDPWSGQTKYNYDLILKFEEYSKKANLMEDIFKMLEARNLNPRDYLKIVDINSDSLEDVVYSGTSGGEANVVYFFLQTNKGFEVVFETMQRIEKVTWSDGLLNEIFVSNWGCCAEFHLINSVYKVEYTSKKKPLFNKTYQSIEVDDELIKPKNYFSTPINFSVQNDGYKLRLSPRIDNSTFFQWLEITGNTIATLKIGTRGSALAAHTDSTGRVWWYVSVSLDENVQNSILKIRDDFPTQIIGWLSSRYLAELEN